MISLVTVEHQVPSGPQKTSVITHVLKVNRNEGITINVPMMYHGVLFPIWVSVLSMRYPTTFVATPSAIWPESIAIL